MQIPTSEQIEKQVSVAADNQLTQKVCESALKKLSSNKNKKRKRKGLAKEIAKATNKTNLLSETVHDTIWLSVESMVQDWIGQKKKTILATISYLLLLQ